MKKRYVLYILVFLSLLLQVYFAGVSRFLPDLAIITIVFASVFGELEEGIKVALVAGIFKGIFSASMFLAYVCVYPAIAVISWLMAMMFYRQSFVIQIVICAVSVFIANNLQLFYLNAVSGNDVKIASVLLNRIFSDIFTIVAAPVVFLLLKETCVVEE